MVEGCTVERRAVVSHNGIIMCVKYARALEVLRGHRKPAVAVNQGVQTGEGGIYAFPDQMFTFTRYSAAMVCLHRRRCGYILITVSHPIGARGL